MVNYNVSGSCDLQSSLILIPCLDAMHPYSLFPLLSSRFPIPDSRFPLPSTISLTTHP
ncbi:MAG: hypothetical protein F6J94_17440 [Moorea sp. SIO1F2]|uniref:hypothetical protein n=1 Tax=Moorena sp. SIO1F2 TaxID=2607819 RepID=UPI0013B762B5|nr:hypothetical protein [Moorena sp. SIO1F2]NET83636.1 hypothetical protein [Moorena sp. SIO1F2]